MPVEGTAIRSMRRADMMALLVTLSTRPHQYPVNGRQTSSATSSKTIRARHLPLDFDHPTNVARPTKTNGSSSAHPTPEVRARDARPQETTSHKPPSRQLHAQSLRVLLLAAAFSPLPSAVNLLTSPKLEALQPSQPRLIAVLPWRTCVPLRLDHSQAWATAAA